MHAAIWPAIGVWAVIMGRCNAKETRRQHTVDEPLPILDSTLQQSIGRSWIEIIARQEKVFGCLHGEVAKSSRGGSAMHAVRMQLAPIDPGECKGSDAIGAVWFFGPKPINRVGYTLDVASQQQRLFCAHPNWLLVGAAYDTGTARLRTSWIVRTPNADAQCASAGNREAVFDSREMEFPLPK